MANTKKEFKSMVTPVFRVSYPAVFTAQNAKGETDEKKKKFGVTMLFDMTNADVVKGVAEMKAFAMEYGKEAWGQDTSKWPVIKHPLFRKGDEPAKREADGTWKSGFGPNVVFCKASLRLFKTDGTQRMPPGLVGPDNKPLIDPNDFYGGCFARAKISAGAYDFAGSQGISFYLMSLRKERDGERFASVHDAADDFDGVPAPTGAAVPSQSSAVAGAAAGVGAGTVAGTNPDPFA